MTRDQRLKTKNMHKTVVKYQNRRKGKHSKKDKAKDKHARERMW